MHGVEQGATGRIGAPSFPGGHAAAREWQEGAARVDVLAQPCELGIDLIGLDLGPPRALDCVAHLGHPPVAAGAEQVLCFERRADGPDALGRFERPPAHRREDGVTRDREALREEPHPGLAVGERAVAAAGIDPVGAQETVQRLARKALGGPWDLLSGARPEFFARGRQDAVDERPVESRVVGDDELAERVDERARGLDVDLPALEVVVG